MFTIILFAYKEAHSIGSAMDALLPQLPPDAELLAICPDAETSAVIRRYAAANPQVRHIADKRRGKPAALNLGVAAARYPLLVYTDGDVVVGTDALANLLRPFSNPNVGAVTGRPLSSSPRNTLFGYWSHLLVHAAHLERTRCAQQGAPMLCSGYLFATRKDLAHPVPEDALAEDAVLSHRIAEAGYTIAYAPEAIVYVKYPDNWTDWLSQKVRSAGGYAQPYIRHSPLRMRSARLEALRGAQMAFRFARTHRELVWTGLLFLGRLYLWVLIFWRVRVQKRSLAQLWQPVKSTK